jgi:hypothetical protein
MILLAGREPGNRFTEIDAQSRSIRRAVSKSIHPGPLARPNPSSAAGDGNSQQERD